MKLNQKFRSLIPPLSKEEYDLLEKSILADGCRDALVTWKGILIDGHNRYEICQKHNLEYDTVEKKFLNEEEARLWIFENQIGRRNLNKFQRTELALKLKDIISKEAKERQRHSKGRGKKGSTDLTNLFSILIPV